MTLCTTRQIAAACFKVGSLCPLRILDIEDFAIFVFLASSEHVHPSEPSSRCRTVRALLLIAFRRIGVRSEKVPLTNQQRKAKVPEPVKNASPEWIEARRMWPVFVRAQIEKHARPRVSYGREILIVSGFIAWNVLVVVCFLVFGP